MQDLGILKAFVEEREKQEQYQAFLKQQQNLEPAIRLLADLIDEYYGKYKDHKYIGKDELMAFYDLKYHEHKDRGFHRSLMERMYDLDISNDIMDDLIEQMLERNWATIMIAELMPVMQGQKHGILPDMRDHVESFIQQMKNPPKESSDIQPYEYNIEELIAGKVNLKGAPWPLAELNNMLGPLQKGTFGLIFANVDCGKTSFALSALRSFADYYKDTDKYLVYACNEEADRRVAERLTQAFLGKAYWEIHEQYQNNWKAAMAAVQEMGMKNIRIVDGVTNIRQIEKILDFFDPECLLIDQGSKVHTNQKVDGIRATRLLYNNYRDLGVTTDTAIIALEQAASTSVGKQWLDLADVYESRVAIQGELDWAIGIGKRVEQQGQEKFRYINVCKNKLKDGKKEGFTVYFDNERCVFRPV